MVKVFLISFFMVVSNSMAAPSQADVEFLKTRLGVYLSSEYDGHLQMQNAADNLVKEFTIYSLSRQHKSGIHAVKDLSEAFEQLFLYDEIILKNEKWKVKQRIDALNSSFYSSFKSYQAESTSQKFIGHLAGTVTSGLAITAAVSSYLASGELNKDIVAITALAPLNYSIYLTIMSGSLRHKMATSLKNLANNMLKSPHPRFLRPLLLEMSQTPTPSRELYDVGIEKLTALSGSLNTCHDVYVGRR
jgi:hypothetical protein